jgi:hypothetical protein
MNHDESLDQLQTELRMPWGSERKEEKLIETMRQLFGDQEKTISQASASVAESKAVLLQLTQQIASVSAQQEAIRLEFNRKWDDLPKLYIPRAEHQAMGLAERTIALEEFRSAATKDITDLKFSFQQQLQQAILTATRDADDNRIAAKEEMRAESKAVTDRQFTWLFSAITITISIISSVALHFLK